MERSEAIVSLEHILKRVYDSEDELKLYYSQRTAIEMAIKDMKLIDQGVKLQKQLSDTVKNFTPKDWKSMNDFIKRSERED